MGSSGTNAYSHRHLEELREEANRRIEQGRIDADVNSFLQQELVDINNRDVDTINGYLAEIEDAIGYDIEEFDRLLFGGSIAKHTYVDGLSDVDALVILNDPSLLDGESAEMRTAFLEALRRNLPMGKVREIRLGRLAVTVEYDDGTVIQLLPAVESGGEVSISSPDGSSWVEIRPRQFAQKLTEINQTQKRMVVPVIKLAKAILARQLAGC